MPDIHPLLLPVSQLQPNPLQPRGKVQKDDLTEIIQSIRTYGILEPIVVAKTPAGYQIIAGERRWRAAKQMGLPSVPVVVKASTPKGMLEMAVIENVQRVDLSPIERAQAFKQLLRDFKFSVQQIADRLGKSSAYVSNTISLLDLPDAVKDGLAGGLISEGHARALLGLQEEKLIVEAYKQTLRESASVRRTEEIVRKVRHRYGMSLRPERDRRVEMSPSLEQWQQKLQDLFDERTKVKLQQSSRQTKLTITFQGSPEETEEKVTKLLAVAKAT